MGLKVAIVGLSPSSLHECPWEDPTWEKWGLPWAPGWWVRFDRCFEMHSPALLHLSARRTGMDGYRERLSGLPRLYMQKSYPEHPNAIAFPYDEVIEAIGADYFNSSIAYMLGLAIAEGAEEIGLYGVDMKASEEYAFQRANCEYLIGVARGKGIKVHIPDVCPLCKFQNDPTNPEFAGRYGLLNGDHDIQRA